MKCFLCNGPHALRDCELFAKLKANPKSHSALKTALLAQIESDAADNPADNSDPIVAAVHEDTPLEQPFDEPVVEDSPSPDATEEDFREAGH